MQSIQVDSLTEILQPVAFSCGLELWGVELLRQRNGGKIRVYIEHDDGITFDHCEKLSRLMDPVLTVKEPKLSEYDLEVSSPGLDRRFFHIEQVVPYENSTIYIQLQAWSDHATGKKAAGWLGTRTAKAQLKRVDLETNSIFIDQFNSVSWKDIIQLRLIPTFD